MLARDMVGHDVRTENLHQDKELGGEILTVGSDAHVPETIGAGVNAAYDLIRAAGFRYITVYEGRKPRFVKL